MVQSHTHAIIGGRRYDAGGRKPNQPRFGFIGCRRPVEILHICSYEHKRNDSSLNAESCSFAIVRGLVADATVPVMPWDDRCVSILPSFFQYLGFRSARQLIICHSALDLGMNTWCFDRFGEAEVVALSQISGQLILCTVPCGKKSYWVTIAHDHVRCWATKYPLALPRFALIQFIPSLSKSKT